MADFPMFVKNKVGKYGKRVVNDFSTNDKFFNSLADYYAILDDAPYKAIEDLAKYESNRDIVIKCIQRLFSICNAAKIDVIAELDRMEESPFDGLEEDLAIKRNAAS